MPNFLSKFSWTPLYAAEDAGRVSVADAGVGGRRRRTARLRRARTTI